MKSFIPKQPKQVRERIEAKLDIHLVRRLEKYCEYLESDRDYVLSQALELIFRKDKGFGAWLEGPGIADSAETLATVPTSAAPSRREGK